MDALFTGVTAIHGLKASEPKATDEQPNGSIDIVRPKMHGPDKVAFTAELFSRVEDVLGLPQTTLKVGHGRGAAHHPRLEGVHQGRHTTASCSSTPVPWTAPATRSRPRWRPAPWCARAP